jgi:D-arabinose 1-dehydrogenase-like Zn-dependent alcohol dehydrogenase
MRDYLKEASDVIFGNKISLGNELEVNTTAYPGRIVASGIGAGVFHRFSCKLNDSTTFTGPLYAPPAEYNCPEMVEKQPACRAMGSVTKDKRVGIVGLGGLGHMGVKFAHALGAHVVVFTTSPNKKEDALRLGANEVVVSRNPDEMKKHAGSFDFILDAVSAEHDINAYINLLRRDGNLTLVGAPAKPLGVSAFGLIMGRRSLSGSNIGSIRETQEMLDFCGAHNITADVEVIPIQQVNEAYERLLKADVKYRFSIDMASIKSE